MSVQKTGASPTGERSDKARTQSPEESLHSLTSMPPRASNGRFMRVVSASPAPVDPGALPEDRFLDREISWLQFNERVLQLAADEAVPLLERAGYLAILRQQPRRVLHGQGGRPQASYRDRPRRAFRLRSGAA